MNIFEPGFFGRRSLTTVMIVMLLLSLGVSAQAQKGKKNKWKPMEEEHAASVAHIRETTQHTWAHQLDLKEPKQYAYVLHMLELGGESPKKSPELYRQLAAAHGEESERELAPPVLDAAAQTANSGDLVPLNFLRYFTQEDDSSSYEAEGLSSYPGGTNMTHVSINLTYNDGNGPQILVQNSASSTQYSQGENFRVPASGTLPAPAANSEVTAHALVLVSQSPNPCAPGPCAYSMTREVAGTSTDGCITAPIYRADQNQNPAKCTNKQTNISTTPLVLCYYRNSGNRQDCDYWSPPPHPPAYGFPISGNATFGKPVQSADYLLLTLQDTTGGGGCLLCGSQGNKNTCPGGGGSLTPANITPSGNQLTWDWTNATFPNGANCITSNGIDTWFTLEMYATLTDGNFASVLFATQQPKKKAPDYPMPIVHILDGCLAAGSEVTLANGAALQIQDFGGGGVESVLSNPDGATRQVLGNTRGTEPIPMVRIEDDAGHSLLLTTEHPVITPEGVVAADTLEVGSVVITRSGPRPLIRVGRETYEGEVYNLKLSGTEEEVREGKTTFFADDFLVGDAQMQSLITSSAARARAERTPAERLRDLPAEWHEDYRNHLTDGQN